MRIGRIEDLEGNVGWAALNPETGCARWILGVFSEWAVLASKGKLSDKNLSAEQLQAASRTTTCTTSCMAGQVADPRRTDPAPNR